MMAIAKTIHAELAQPTLMDAPVPEAERPALRVVQPHRVVNDIHIERLILHALDNQSGQSDLVDVPAELTDEAEAFFAQHISAASERAEWGAEFTDPGSDVPEQCFRLLGTRDQFVNASKSLALRLFEQMQARPKNISPGDFVAIVYTAGDVHVRHVALLKLELDSRWARTFTGSTGQRRVQIAIAKNLFADTKRLQKCALLMPIGAPDAEGRSDFEITLLDTQAGPRAAEAIAGFFYRGFLTTALLPTPRRQTRAFLRRTNSWLLDKNFVLTPMELGIFIDARRAALRHDALNIEAFASTALPAHPELQADLTRLLSSDVQMLPKQAVEGVHQLSIDRDFAKPIVEHVVIEMDAGMTLKIPSDHYHDLVRIQPGRTPENKTRIIIETLTFKEVVER